MLHGDNSYQNCHIWCREGHEPCGCLFNEGTIGDQEHIPDRKSSDVWNVIKDI